MPKQRGGKVEDTGVLWEKTKRGVGEEEEDQVVVVVVVVQVKRGQPAQAPRVPGQ